MLSRSFRVMGGLDENEGWALLQLFVSLTQLNVNWEVSGKLPTTEVGMTNCLTSLDTDPGTS